MKISRVILQNFESHENSIIEFCDGFNCIVGPSNAGKTAIFNAILFALFNEWDPGFVRKGAAFCKVILECDSVKIERVKGEGVNYVIVTKNGNEYRFENFGKDYPAEVKKVIGLPSFEDCLPCIGFQDNGAFLIYDSSTTRGSYINKIIGVELFNAVLSSLQLSLKDIDFTIREYERQKQQYLAELSKLKHIDKLERLAAKLDKLEAKRTTICQLIETVTFYRSRLAETDTEQLQAALSEISPSLFDEYLSFCQNFEQLLFLYTNISRVRSEISKVTAQLEDVSRRISSYTAELTQLIRQSKICPFCGNVLSEESINHIFKDLAL